MTTHIVFHADIDGIISAALMLRQAEEYKLYPVLTSQRNEKFKLLIKSMKLTDSDCLVIVDFEQHDRADLWVDHHYNKDMGDSSVKNKKILYDPSSKSAAHIIWEKFNGCQFNVIHLADMIDSAGYQNVDYIFNDEGPLMILRAYLETSFPSDMMFCRVVEVLVNANFDLHKTISRLNLSVACVNELKKKALKSKQFLEIYGNMSLIRQKRSYQFPRYSECWLRPDVKYNLRVSIVNKEKWHLQLAYNKWHKDTNELNIGKYLFDLKMGSGHHNVGGGVLQEDKLDEFIDNLSLIVNGDEDMEKYGVDKKADNFEKAAEDMVKTGGAKDINEAREKVGAKKEEGKNAKSDGGSAT